jgi:hypothetical protein
LLLGSIHRQRMKATNNIDNADTPVVPTPTQDHQSDRRYIYGRKLENPDFQANQEKMNEQKINLLNETIRHAKELLADAKKVLEDFENETIRQLADKKKVLEDFDNSVKTAIQEKKEMLEEQQENFDRYCLTLPAIGAKRTRTAGPEKI